MAEQAHTLGAHLRRLREIRGMSLRALADRAGVDHAYIWRLESGEKTEPSEDILEKILAALDITMGQRVAARVLKGCIAPMTASDLRRVAAVLDEVHREWSRCV